MDRNRVAGRKGLRERFVEQVFDRGVRMVRQSEQRLEADRPSLGQRNHGLKNAGVVRDTGQEERHGVISKRTGRGTVAGNSNIGSHGPSSVGPRCDKTITTP